MAGAFVVVAHGTADPRGLAVLEEITIAAARLIGTAPHLAFVDVVAPTAAEVVRVLPNAVLVPLFLASGYHVRVDLPLAAQDGSGVVVTPPLGSGAPVIEALTDRLLDRGIDPQAVVLVAAGSSAAQARAEVARAAEDLGAVIGRPTFPAFLSGPGPTFAAAVDAARATGARHIVAAAHLLAPGHFQSKLEREAAAVGIAATAPIGAHPSVVAEVAHRYRHAVWAAAGQDRAAGSISR